MPRRRWGVVCRKHDENVKSSRHANMPLVSRRCDDSLSSNWIAPNHKCVVCVCVCAGAHAMRRP